jgi:hypothetical protein
MNSGILNQSIELIGIKNLFNIKHENSLKFRQVHLSF